MFIDSHCHLNFSAFKNDLDEVLNRAGLVGISAFIIPGAKLDSSNKAIEISNRYSSCFAAVGIHPHHVEGYNDFGIGNLEKELLKLAAKEKVVAVGEIGLDYYRYKNYPLPSAENIKLQTELMEFQIGIAVSLGLPVIFHCREAQTDLINIVGKYKDKNLKGVFHCFDGDLAYLKKVLSLGFYVGFDGNITYPPNEHLRELVKKTPLASLLIETDSPFLAPQPHRGERNEPVNIPIIAETVANLIGKPVDEVAAKTRQNAVKLFQIPDSAVLQ